MTMGTVGDTTLIRMPTLHIFTMGDWLKVFRVYARMIPAQMVKLKAFWDGAHKQFIGKTMGQDTCAFWFAGPETSILIPIMSAYPQPTIIGAILIDFGPEALFSCDRDKLFSSSFTLPMFLAQSFTVEGMRAFLNGAWLGDNLREHQEPPVLGVVRRAVSEAVPSLYYTIGRV